MKKVIITLAVFVMAFGNANLFAQRSERLAMIQKQVMEKYRGSRDDSWYAPSTATYTELDGVSTRTFRNNYTYDEYEYYLVEKLVELKVGNDWINYQRVSYERDFLGAPLQMLVQEWNGNSWSNESNVTYSYDDNDQLLEVISQSWENGAWINEEKMVYSYNDMAYTIITYWWDGVWRTDELYTITLDLSGGYEVLVQYMQGGAWQNDERITYSMNDIFLLDRVLWEDWMDNAWYNVELALFAYDGDLVAFIDFQEWEYGAWANDAKVTYTYQNGNATYGIYQEWIGNQLVNANGEIEMFYANNAESEVFENANEVEMQYVDLTSVAENMVMNYSVCPNPASESLVVNGEGFMKAEIYNVAGQKVIESGMNTINVSDLQSGIYLLKVFDVNGHAETQSIVIK